MGSTGVHKQSLQQNNSTSVDEFTNGWDFPGIRDSVDRLEQQLNRTRSVSGTSRILKALREQEVVINRALAENNPNNDRNALLTYRRRIRQMMGRIRIRE